VNQGPCKLWITFPCCCSSSDEDKRCGERKFNVWEPTTAVAVRLKKGPIMVKSTGGCFSG